MNIRKFLNQDCSYWAPASKDEYGNIVYAAPVDLKMRMVMSTTKKGAPVSDIIVPEATILVIEQLESQGMIALGLVDDLNPVNLLIAIQTMIDEAIDDSSSGIDLGTGKILATFDGNDLVLTCVDDAVNDTLADGIYEELDSSRSIYSVDSVTDSLSGAQIIFEDIKTLIENGDSFSFVFNSINYSSLMGVIIQESPTENSAVEINNIMPFIDRKGTTLGYEITTKSQFTFGHPGGA